MRCRHLAAAFAVMLLGSAGLQAAAWNIDGTHSSATFKVRHLGISNVTGGFQKLSGALTLDEADVTKSTVEAVIDATSLDTGDPKRDEHLKSPDFFDVAAHPTITFKSKKVEKAGEGKLKVTGDLTMRGVTKEVILDVTGPLAPITAFGGLRSGVSATTTINRQDFGVAWSKLMEGGGLVVGNDVAVSIDLELVQKK
jgi:polyisoprenoid-binding protein YceI